MSVSVKKKTIDPNMATAQLFDLFQDYLEKKRMSVSVKKKSRVRNFALAQIIDLIRKKENEY